MPKTRYF